MRVTRQRRWPWKTQDFSFSSVSVKSFSGRFATGMLYLCFAIWATWPLALNANQSIPVGILQLTTVPLFNVWTLWWNCDRLLHGFHGYWNAPIFHPATGTFAFSEPQPMTVLAAPVLWMTGSPLLAYNFYLILSLVLNGVFAESLLRQLRLPQHLARIGAITMILLPIVHWQLDVLQLIPLWGVLWTLSECWNVSRKPSISAGCRLGVAYTIAFYLSGHQGLFLALLLAGSFWGLWFHGATLRRLFQAVWGASSGMEERFDCRAAQRLAVACLTGVATVIFFVGPIAIPMQRELSRYEFRRRPEVIENLSVVPSDYLETQGPAWIDTGFPFSQSFWKLSPGWLKVSLAVVAVAFGCWRRRWRSWTFFLLLMTLLAFLLSLGPHLRFGNWQPWWSISQFVPGFSRVRNVFRFAFFLQITVTLLAIQGLNHLGALNRWWVSNQKFRAMWRLSLLVVGLGVIFEVRLWPPPLKPVPDLHTAEEWIRPLREQAAPGQTVACFPFPKGDQVSDFEGTTRWMYFGTAHKIPLVNGYSGFFPPEYFELQNELNRSFPDEATLRRLSGLGVGLLVLDRLQQSSQDLDQKQFSGVKVTPVIVNPEGVSVYRLEAQRSAGLDEKP